MGGPGGQLFFYHDQTRCIGCKACAVACKDWNDIDPGPTQWRRIYDVELGTFPALDVFHVNLACFHCVEPVCVTACPNKALVKRPEDGIVLLDGTKCKSSGDCVKACPYGAPQLPNPVPGESRMTKCHFCADRWKEGKKPACVDSCIMRALDAGTEAELRARYPGAVDLGAPVPGFPTPDRGPDGRPIPGPMKPSILLKPRQPRVGMDRRVIRLNSRIVERI